MESAHPRIVIALVITFFFAANLQAAEAIKHSSGFVFPATVASFQREHVEKNEKGITVRYREAKALAVITVSIYPAAAPYSAGALRKHFNDCVRQIGARVGPMQRVLEAETKPRGSYRGYGGMLNYNDTFGGRMQQVLSFLNVYQSGDHIVKVQETYPDASADASAGAIGKFGDAFAWPK
jgi:hypothetical protein